MKLSTLSIEDLRRIPAWRSIGDYTNDADKSLEPIVATARGLPVPADVGEVWCLSRARFANGSEHDASSMCRGDCGDGPLAWSVWNGTDDVPLLLPPAPDFVLRVEGPELFAARFGLTVGDVFPMVFWIVPRFAVNPAVRAITLDLSGRREVRNP